MGDNAHPNSNEKTCVLWQNEDHTVTLLDIPRSLELAQQFEHKDERKLWSSPPLKQPYPSLEPKSRKAIAALKAPDIGDLILRRVLTLALEEAGAAIGKDGNGSLAWCLSRSCYDEELSSLQDAREVKRHHISHGVGVASNDVSSPLLTPSATSHQYSKTQGEDSDSSPSSPLLFYKNTSGRTTTLPLPGGNSPAIVPVNSALIQGEIVSTLPIFAQNAPQFPLILLDPPWPNRSARRAGSYQTSYGLSEISALLSSIPIKSKLQENGLVGVWITNKESFRNLLLGKDGDMGLFAEWGIELVEEWVWLKITENGEPMSPVDGTWRKPYEILLVGRNISNVEIDTDSCEVAPQSELDEIPGTGRGKEVGISDDEPFIVPMPVKRRVIIAVPDMHSRKPNLMAIFAPLLPHTPDPPRCLEIFARNLTADSWAWGNEVLKFQRLEHWTTECADTKQVAEDIEECVVPV
ncbi:hypothetical protein V490_02242 [Pseudogymnoascus sp. VKM F-3557]|nr:hypothetical protein V490_02242 [Pseudogymnoascus sp. VKM F-3557]